MIHDIKATNIAIGNTKETLNKIFIFDYSSSVPISLENSAKTDLIMFGLVLLELNGIKFPPLWASAMEQIITNTDEIIEMLSEEWNKNYAEVNWNCFSITNGWFPFCSHTGVIHTIGQSGNIQRILWVLGIA